MTDLVDTLLANLGKSRDDDRLDWRGRPVLERNDAGEGESFDLPDFAKPEKKDRSTS